MTAYVVTGPRIAVFPIDLLRQDGAFPLTPGDAFMLERLLRGDTGGMPETVSVALSGTAPLAPGRERWELHGWQVRKVGG